MSIEPEKRNVSVKWIVKCTSISGFFAQSLPETDDLLFDFRKSDFGLLIRKNTDPSVPDWAKFRDEIAKMNALEQAQNTSYRVLFIARHGQGFHNVAEAFYGTSLWDSEYSLLNGHQSFCEFPGQTWGPDGDLTNQGIMEAEMCNSVWKSQLRLGAPLPESFYCSPFTRAARTCMATWNGIVNFESGSGSSSPESTLPVRPKPRVLENLRETNGVHTCDNRSSRSILVERFPLLDVPLPPLFSELDELFNPTVRESDELRDTRITAALTQIFGELGDEATYLSLTGHSGTTSSFLKVLGHREFRIQTGGVIPVVVKVVKTKIEVEMMA